VVHRPALSAARRARLGRRALWLAYTTVGYNLIEAAVALIAGVAASSAALIGFGGDSLIEVSSALVLIWQYRSRAPRSGKNGRCAASRSASSNWSATSPSTPSAA
jgi:hypothetical protein